MNREEVGGFVNKAEYKIYEELEGASDRRIRYRSPRFAATELFPMETPSVTILNTDFALHNLSMTGLAVLGANDNALEVGTSAPVTMRYGSKTIFEGQGRIVRSEDYGGGAQFGVCLEGDYLDIPQLREVHREHLIARQIVPQRLRTARLVPEAYRRACADAIDLVRSCEPFLEEANDLLPDEERGILDTVENEITPLWLDLCREIDPILADVSQDADALDALKRFTERVVTPEFMAGPIWKRAFMKPLGYPGDYGVMDYIYSGRDVGATSYGRLLHRLGVASLDCVETRMMMMRDMLSELLSESGLSSAMSITSIGCGGSEEVRQALRRPVGRHAQFTLIDQDDRALNASFERIHPETLRIGDQVSVNCLQTGFQRLVDPSSIGQLIPPQDLIYSLGIPDYLKQSRAKRFCRSLYKQLKPGGQLVVANVQDLPDNGRWRAECIADWKLIYRTWDEMSELARDLDGTFEVREDPTRKVLMLSIRKPN